MSFLDIHPSCDFDLCLFPVVTPSSPGFVVILPSFMEIIVKTFGSGLFFSPLLGGFHKLLTLHFSFSE